MSVCECVLLLLRKRSKMYFKELPRNDKKKNWNNSTILSKNHNTIYLNRCPLILILNMISIHPIIFLGTFIIKSLIKLLLWTFFKFNVSNILVGKYQISILGNFYGSNRKGEKVLQLKSEMLTKKKSKIIYNTEIFPRYGKYPLHSTKKVNFLTLFTFISKIHVDNELWLLWL